MARTKLASRFEPREQLFAAVAVRHVICAGAGLCLRNPHCFDNMSVVTSVVHLSACYTEMLRFATQMPN